MSGAPPSTGLGPVQSRLIDTLTSVLGTGPIVKDFPCETRLTAVLTSAPKTPMLSPVMDTIATRRSSRVAQVAEAKAKLAALEAAAQKQKAEEEAAAAEAAAGAPGSMRTALRMELKHLKEDRDAIYRVASENLLPVLLVSTAELDTPTEASVRLPDFFTEGLTDVCAQVYGSAFTRAVATGFSAKKALRDFFEFENPKDQCDAVLKGQVIEVCWICGTSLQPPECASEKSGRCEQDCEHKLPVLLALLLTGLYDGFLYKVLIEKGLGDQYLNLLRFEYDYGHPLCNRLKKDAVFLKSVYGGRRGGSSVVSFEPDRNKIQSTLEKISRGGNLPAPSLTTILAERSEKDFVEDRTGSIRDSLSGLIARLNRRGFTARQLCNHFANGLLDRAIQFAPELTQEYLWNSLSPAQQSALTNRLTKKQGSSRRRTPHRRRRSRRVLRGGAVDAVLWSALSEFVKPMQIETLVNSVLTGLDSLPPSDGLLSQWSYVIETAFEEHTARVDEITDQLYEDVMRRSFLNEDHLLTYIYVRAGDVATSEMVDDREAGADSEDGEEDSPVAVANAAAPMNVDTSSGDATPPPRQPVNEAQTVPNSLFSPSASSMVSGLSLGQADSPMSGSVSRAQQRPTSEPPTPSTSEAEGAPEVKRIKKAGYRLGPRPDWL